MPKFDFQSQFSMSKIIRIFLNSFFIEEYQSRSTFFDIVNFLIFLKRCPIKDTKYCWMLSIQSFEYFTLTNQIIVIGSNRIKTFRILWTIPKSPIYFQQCTTYLVATFTSIIQQYMRETKVLLTSSWHQRKIAFPQIQKSLKSFKLFG